MSADAAIRALTEEARRFAKLQQGRNTSGAYGFALKRLVNAARVFATKSDEEWAQEVVDAKAAGLLNPNPGDTK